MPKSRAKKSLPPNMISNREYRLRLWRTRLTGTKWTSHAGTLWTYRQRFRQACRSSDLQSPLRSRQLAYPLSLQVMTLLGKLQQVLARRWHLVFLYWNTI
ncbi:ATP-dependent RNA helicase MAK5 [Histoplasma capsulatum G186AR]|uniref:ATP-dependent RNA helicase MAK5 n=1 Tax=Ajellomyces capsulatus TaxID=5037 RepID=A0A8H7Z1R7_AJECA|nr:ATP-dependent RNA helicase MAK5 [Histoplasma capsulatum]QSS68789.1 ATP-dependent RNA helicase MAK5 [Histoplasma capsulatum G186AR]